MYSSCFGQRNGALWTKPMTVGVQLVFTIVLSIETSAVDHVIVYALDSSKIYTKEKKPFMLCKNSNITWAAMYCVARTYPLFG